MADKKIKGVLFDMDGTMFDTETMSIYIWAATARYYNINISREFMMECMGLSTKAIGEKFDKAFGDVLNYETFRSAKNKVMEEIVEEDGVPHKKGLTEILDYIKENGIKAAIATSTSNERAVYNLEEGKVIQYFDEVISGDMVDKSKPEPDIYLLAAKKLGLRPEECMVLEDSKNGIISARRANCLAVLVPEIIAVDDEMIEAADYVCEDLLEVIDLIKRINK